MKKITAIVALSLGLAGMVPNAASAAHDTSNSTPKKSPTANGDKKAAPTGDKKAPPTNGVKKAPPTTVAG
jgi:hypothetical protein